MALGTPGVGLGPDSPLSQDGGTAPLLPLHPGPRDAIPDTRLPVPMNWALLFLSWVAVPPLQKREPRAPSLLLPSHSLKPRWLLTGAVFHPEASDDELHQPPDKSSPCRVCPAAHRAPEPWIPYL